MRTTGVLLNPIRLPRAPSPSLVHVVIDPHCGCKALLPCLRRLIKQRAGVLSGLGPYTDGELVNYFPHRLLLVVAAFRQQPPYPGPYTDKEQPTGGGCAASLARAVSGQYPEP